MIMDDRRNQISETSDVIPRQLDDRPVTSVRRIHLQTAPTDTARWKVFELNVNR